MLFKKCQKLYLSRFLFVICCFIIIALTPLETKAYTLDLTSGYWLVNGHDSIVYDGSKLNFQSQIFDGTNYLLDGYFDWMSTDGSHYGREIFLGTLFPDLSLLLNGTQIVPPASGINLASYEAEVTTDGTKIVNGIWYSPAGVWSATHVPIPAAIWLLATGFAGLLAIKRKSQG